MWDLVGIHSSTLSSLLYTYSYNSIKNLKTLIYITELNITIEPRYIYIYIYIYIYSSHTIFLYKLNSIMKNFDFSVHKKVQYVSSLTVVSMKKELTL